MRELDQKTRMISCSIESLQCLKMSSPNDQIRGKKFDFYLKGLSLVPSSEGFTITAFLPAYLNKNKCSVAKKSHVEKLTKKERKVSNLPESSRTTLPPFMIFPMTTSERNSTLRSHLNQDFNGIPSKTFKRVGVGQDHIYLPFFDLIFLR